MGNYTLQKYKGTATRHTCPSCGDKRSFTYYVDESGTPLHPSVGRCNHESSCGYHYTPKEYFHDHPECRTANGLSFGRQRSERKSVQIPPQATIGCIPPKVCGEVAKRALAIFSASFHRSWFLLRQQGKGSVEAVAGRVPFGSYP